jgi:hypothetical protein
MRLVPKKVENAHSDAVWCAAFAGDSGSLLTGKMHPGIYISARMKQRGRRIPPVNAAPSLAHSLTPPPYLRHPPSSLPPAHPSPSLPPYTPLGSVDESVKRWTLGESATPSKLLDCELGCVAIDADPAGTTLAAVALDGSVTLAPTQRKSLSSQK